MLRAGSAAVYVASKHHTDYAYYVYGMRGTDGDVQPQPRGIEEEPHTTLILARSVGVFPASSGRTLYTSPRLRAHEQQQQHRNRNRKGGDRAKRRAS